MNRGNRLIEKNLIVDKCNWFLKLVLPMFIWVVWVYKNIFIYGQLQWAVVTWLQFSVFFGYFLVFTSVSGKKTTTHPLMGSLNNCCVLLTLHYRKGCKIRCSHIGTLLTTTVSWFKTISLGSITVVSWGLPAHLGMTVLPWAGNEMRPIVGKG